MITPTYDCPACGRAWATDQPRWRCDCGSHLNLMPGDGLSRGEIATGRGFAMALRRGIGIARTAARFARRGLDPAGAARLAGRPGLVQARIADADRVVQGPRHRRHDQPSDRGRGRADPRGFLGQRRLFDRDLCGGGRHPVPHLCPGRGATRQAGADRRLRRRGSRDPGHPPGGDRGGARRCRRKLLRQPQLAPLFYRGHQDPGL